MQVPNHIALITDGNRRWAVSRKLPPWKGHWEGGEKVDKFLHWCLESGVKHVSIWALSTENFQRSKKELKELMKVFAFYIRKLVDSELIQKYEVRINFLGNLQKLPRSLIKLMHEVMEKTSRFTKRVLNILIGYGGQFEIVEAFRKLAQKILRNGRIQISKRDIENNLLVKTPVELVIRTGGYSRLSNFMLWQTAYAEMYVTDKLLPDFTKQDFKKALTWFSKTKRNLGK